MFLNTGTKDADKVEYTEGDHVKSISFELRNKPTDKKSKPRRRVLIMIVNVCHDTKTLENSIVYDDFKFYYEVLFHNSSLIETE
ncbi:hypothetical protein GCM10011344_22290 [Dokdonia pacifica]|uniref:Uncharacterized protein n=1 Tax=Dokdonia pacifica TaxID=1627892 RepID=A0A238WGJ1_9FLAO|nr:hypothetical protein [Dokdonia pacifica]GGG21047.1 hypothetical protein GCM10011344_22290 [Dokdonia pacifica]SNR45716.1 hypothetical protein SAMN06265376_1011061 [Dokdonia pacifica]